MTQRDEREEARGADEDARQGQAEEKLPAVGRVLGRIEQRVGERLELICPQHPPRGDQPLEGRAQIDLHVDR